MKKLIIVCEEKLRRYGDFLAQLISGTDDIDGKTIGLKDGSAAAQVWTEKEYASNASQISSEQYLLFVGNSKLIKDKRHHMVKKYSEFGMNYGWLGKQAVLFVDRSLSFSEYEDFYKLASAESAEGKQEGMVRLLPEWHGSPDDEIAVADIEIQEEAVIIDTAEEEQQVKDNAPKAIAPLKAAKAALKKSASHGKESLYRMTGSINASTKRKEIEEQQYSCLVLLFYLNDLGKFLGVSEA